MGDPRIHFAIVGASSSCPKLLKEADASDRLEMQLTAKARDFFANPENFQYDVRGQRFQVSSILE